MVKHGGDIVASMIVADARGTVRHSDAANTDDVSAVWSLAGTIVTLTGSVAEGAPRLSNVMQSSTCAYRPTLQRLTFRIAQRLAHSS